MNRFFPLLALLSLCGTALAEKPDAAPAETPAVTQVVPATPAPKNTAVIKVNVTFQAWNNRIPWQKASPGARRGLGVLIDENRILVTGQMVADATYIELELADSGRKIPAKVKAVDYEANLALLEASGSNVKDFFQGLKPIQLDTQARIGDQLQVWQLGRVGDLIVTPLEINKVLVSRYVLETSSFLVYETIGIIRSESNSFTLPVMKDGKLAGLLLRYDSKNQAATVLPAPIIDHFLKDMSDGAYQGFPSLGIEFQITLDDQFREYLGMAKDQQGVYISSVAKGGSAESVGLKEKDIVLELNGKAVDARGDYKDDQFGTLNMSHLVRGASYVGDEVTMKVLREGKETTLKGKLTRKNAQDYVVPPYRFDRGPNYLVQGGLLFQELSLPFLQSFGEDWETSAPLRLAFVAKHTEDFEKEGYRKIIILTASLPTRTTQGYDRLGGQIVTKVNGIDIKDLADMEKAFQEPQNGLHTIEFEDFPKVIYLDAMTAISDNIRLQGGMFRIGSLKRIE